MTSLVLSLALAGTAKAQESDLSKSITTGWKSVVKQTSKAAKSVTKAANDALASEKPKRKKSSKRKSDHDEAKAADAPDEPAPSAKKRPRDDAAAPSAKQPRKAQDKPQDQPKEARRQPDSLKPLEDEEGPPVPLTNAPPPPSQATVKAPDEPRPPAPKPSGPKRLPPPPPIPSKAEARPPTGWTAATKPAGDMDEPKADAKRDRQGDQGETPAVKPLPITMIPPKAADGTAAVGWSPEEIATAKANCAAILKSVDAVTTPEAPVREGSCGAPAPVRLISIGKNPEVALSPQPLVTCELVAGLHQWIKNDIQPLAKKHLGAPIKKIETMSDYSCRMAYGRKGNKLSEHGRANALDIRGFVTGKGETAVVLDQWGKTERDYKAEATKRAAEKAAALNAAEAAAAAGAKSAIETPSSTPAKSNDPIVVKRAEPTRASLGTIGLKPALVTEDDKAAAVIVPDAPRSKQAQFLRDAHTSACRIFGTSLGPESNEAHRNHFHVDMAERKRTKICE